MFACKPPQKAPVGVDSSTATLSDTPSAPASISAIAHATRLVGKAHVALLLETNVAGIVLAAAAHVTSPWGFRRRQLIDSAAEKPAPDTVMIA
jgi:hypothetical protein